MWWLGSIIFFLSQSNSKSCEALADSRVSSLLTVDYWNVLDRRLMTHRTSILAFYSIVVTVLVSCLPAVVFAQVKSPAQRLRELEQRVKQLGEEIDTLEKDSKEAKKEDEKRSKGGDFFSDGLITVGGVELRIGGNIRLQFLDTQNESDPLVEDTDNADPHLRFDRVRIVPHLRFNRHLSARGQFDFRSNGARVKEFTARFRANPTWWFQSRTKIGIDDRLIRPDRLTRTYPMAGTGFWRDESLALFWTLRFGDPDGRPDPGKKKKKKKKKKRAPLEEEDLVFEDDSESFDGPVEGSNGKSSHPFDLARNWGELAFLLSVGNGYVLNNRAVGFDRSSINEIVQDDRNVNGDDLTLSSLEGAVRYRRNFDWLGEIGMFAMLNHDRLSDDSREFLQEELTVRNNAGAAVGGYGDSSSRKSRRYGLGADYFLPARSLFGSSIKTRRRDGLHLLANWIEAVDGDDFERTSWFGQAAYRYSFPYRLIADRYMRSVTALVRYGEWETNLDKEVALPGTWDRERLLLALITEVTREVEIKVEYTLNWENTGGGGGAGPSSVDNNELMIELQLFF